MIIDNHLTDEEYMRSLYNKRAFSPVIDELCSRLERAGDNAPDEPGDDEDDEPEEVECPICEGKYIPGKDQP